MLKANVKKIVLHKGNYQIGTAFMVYSPLAKLMEMSMLLSICSLSTFPITASRQAVGSLMSSGASNSPAMNILSPSCVKPNSPSSSVIEQLLMGASSAPENLSCSSSIILSTSSCSSINSYRSRH